MKLKLNTQGLELAELKEKLERQFPEYRYHITGRIARFQALEVRKNFFVRASVQVKKDGIEVVVLLNWLLGFIVLPFTYSGAKSIVDRVSRFLSETYAS